MTELLAKTVILTPDEAKTHKYYAFTVPAGLTRLEVGMEYAPKFFTDKAEGARLVLESVEHCTPWQELTAEEVAAYLPLSNHIGVSIDSPVEWLGSAHRHDKKQLHFISAAESAYGFKTSEIYEGEWRVTLSLNAVMCPVTVQLKVVGL